MFRDCFILFMNKQQSDRCRNIVFKIAISGSKFIKFQTFLQKYTIFEGMLAYFIKYIFFNYGQSVLFGLH